MTRLILASASPARLATLRSAGFDPMVRVSGIDEDAALDEERNNTGPLTFAEVPLVLARAKARSVAAVADLPPDVVVIGCDSVLELDGEIYGKPHTEEIARERIRQMRGTSGTLHTGHWLIDAREVDHRETGATSSTIVHFADDITDDEIEDYIRTREPLEVAGSFTIDGYGGPFVSGIEGDHHGVIGISLPTMRRLLQVLGISITKLWSGPL